MILATFRVIVDERILNAKDVARKHSVTNKAKKILMRAITGIYLKE